jgi:hypothetical protein
MILWGTFYITNLLSRIDETKIGVRIKISLEVTIARKMLYKLIPNEGLEYVVIVYNFL